LHVAVAVAVAVAADVAADVAAVAAIHATKLHAMHNALI